MFSILPRDGLLIFRGTTLVPILPDRLSLICLTRRHVASYLVCILSVQKQNSGVKLNYTLNLTKLPAADLVSLKEKMQSPGKSPCTIIVDMFIWFHDSTRTGVVSRGKIHLLPFLMHIRTILLPLCRTQCHIAAAPSAHAAPHETAGVAEHKAAFVFLVAHPFFFRNALDIFF